VGVDARPGAGVELFVVEDFEVRGEVFEVGVDCFFFCVSVCTKIGLGKEGNGGENVGDVRSESL
jgi:hypothetical protein